MDCAHATFARRWLDEIKEAGQTNFVVLGVSFSSDDDLLFRVVFLHRSFAFHLCVIKAVYAYAVCACIYFGA